ncbi:MAG TPA: carboxymuconolactone decarboxylase family protein [Ktedonobacteraceae bacterium]|nr:carboxymuconolactone decarboxylase family protein [Ktedonobacteraceae bacterium]
MPRIPPIDIELPADGATSFSTMATLFRTMAHRPELMRQAMQLLETAMRAGTVDPALKELLAIRVSQVNACFY